MIETVCAGRSLVVKVRLEPANRRHHEYYRGVHDGQTVLFVAEKMATLEVVYDRLDKVGLDDICLELHDGAANKRLVAELDRTLQATAGASETDGQQPIDCGG